MSKTRLTNSQREAIVVSAMAATDFEARKQEIVKAATQAAEAAVRATQPEGYYQRTDGLPIEWLHIATGVYVGLFASFRRCDLRHLYFDSPVPVGIHDFSDAVSEAVKPFAEQLERWHKEYESTRRELRAFLQSCRHVEDVIKRMPELEPHCPRVAAAYPVVAPSNALSMLIAAGFKPKEKGHEPGDAGPVEPAHAG